MSRRYDSGYDPSKIRMIPFPSGEDCGDGWWRVEWTVTTVPADPPAFLRLPIPTPYLEDLTMIIAVLPQEPGRIIVDVLIRGPQFAWNEIAYLSLVMQAISELYQQTTIDGHLDHPVLHVSKSTKEGRDH